jgi:protein-disulfide isomerase
MRNMALNQRDCGTKKAEEEGIMLKKGFWGGMCLLLFICFFAQQGFSQEDNIGAAAINILRTQVRLPQGTEIRFLEKKESPIPDYYSVKLLVVLPDKEVPVVLYVNKSGEKVFLGNLFIRGENVTMKEAGPPKLKKTDMADLEMGKSPFIGAKEAKVTIVEFANFQCSYCMDSWSKLTEVSKKYPNEIKYVFKHFPFEQQGKAFELSEIAASAQEINNEAFWAVHDFIFTNEGQAIASLDKEAVKQQIEQMLKGKGYDVGAFRSALETGKAKKRVQEDMALGNSLHITGTPTKIINGDIIVGPTPEDVVERYLRR